MKHESEYRLIFFGTPEFVLPVLEILWSMRPAIELATVVTALDKPTGREQILSPPPVKTWAEKHGIAILQPEKLDSTFVAELKRSRPTIGIIAAYGKIIPGEVLDCFSQGVINVHPSLLPRWRGPSPVQAAILSGDTEIGVTLMITDEEMDHGPILTQERITLRDDETADALTRTLFQQGAAFLPKTLLPWLRGEIIPKPQDHDHATFTKILRREDGRIDWHRPVEQILRMIRAYDPWPGVFTSLPDGRRLKILRASRADMSNDVARGTVAQGNDSMFLVRAGDGWVRLDLVQREGGSPMDGVTFLRGLPHLQGKLLV